MVSVVVFDQGYMANVYFLVSFRFVVRHGKLIVSLHVHIVVRFDACGRDIMVSITRYVDKFEVAFHVC